MLCFPTACAYFFLNTHSTWCWSCLTCCSPTVRTCIVSTLPWSNTDRIGRFPPYSSYVFLMPFWSDADWFWYSAHLQPIRSSFPCSLYLMLNDLDTLLVHSSYVFCFNPYVRLILIELDALLVRRTYVHCFRSCFVWCWPCPELPVYRLWVLFVPTFPTSDCTYFISMLTTSSDVLLIYSR